MADAQGAVPASHSRYFDAGWHITKRCAGAAEHHHPAGIGAYNLQERTMINLKILGATAIMALALPVASATDSLLSPR